MSSTPTFILGGRTPTQRATVKCRAKNRATPSAHPSVVGTWAQIWLMGDEREANLPYNVGSLGSPHAANDPWFSHFILKFECSIASKVASVP